MSVAPYVVLYLIPVVTSIALAVYGWKQRRYRAAEPFSLLMASLAFWSTCHALSVADPTLQGTLFWAQMQYGGIVLVGPLWLLFALAYADQWSRATVPLRAALLLPAVLAYIAVLTNDQHSLWWTHVGLDASRPFVSLSVERGLLFWLHTIYSYGCILVGIGLFVHVMVEAPPIYRHQSQLVVIGAFIPVVGNLAHLLGMQTRAVDDPTPFLFAASGLVLAFAALRYQLLDLVPIAQREVFESMPDGVVALDQRGIVALINPPVPRLFAVQHSQWVGRTLLDLVRDSPLTDALRDMLTSPLALPSRRVTYTGDDGLNGVEIRLRPLLSDNGQRAGSLLVLRDTTESVRMEQALDQRLADLTAINRTARAANAAIKVVDVLRVVTHEIVQSITWDRVAIGLLQPDGTTLRLVIDQCLDAEPLLEGQYLAADDFGLILDVLHAGQTQALHVSDPLVCGTPTGHTLRQLGIHTLLVVPLYSQAKPLGLLLVGSINPRGVSSNEVRLFETLGELVTEAIVRTHLYEEAQQASQLKSAFLATVSHELRTPLTSILGYEDLMRRGIFGTLPEEMEEPLDHMRRSGRALLRLINDILDFSKLEAGLFDVDLYSVNLAIIIHNVVGAMQPQIYERGLRMHLDLDPDLPLVRGNSLRLEQVLTNLLSNAIKFTEKGTITVRAARRGDHVRFSVQDTGIGIAPEHQEVIFRAFHQVQNPHTRRFNGTGLGLSISRRLVELMDGTLSVESVLGIGATFHCDLRLASISTLEQERVVG